MTFRNIALSFALVALSAPGFAGSSFVGGEVGFVDQPVLSGKSRSDVLREFEAFRANPVDADGGRVIGGEEGYVMPSPRSGSPKPSAIRTPAEAAWFQSHYPA